MMITVKQLKTRVYPFPETPAVGEMYILCDIRPIIVDIMNLQPTWLETLILTHLGVVSNHLMESAFERRLGHDTYRAVVENSLYLPDVSQTLMAEALRFCGDYDTDPVALLWGGTSEQTKYALMCLAIYGLTDPEDTSW